MTPRLISKAAFAERVLEILREIEESGQPVLITDGSHPIVKVQPYFGDGQVIQASLTGTLISYVDPTEPVGEQDWEALH
jgi:hypothetical protein